MKAHGEILLISCYELGHQPNGLSLPMGFLRRKGYLPDAIDISVEPLDPVKMKRARFIGISVPMHTALRLGVEVAKKAKAVNPTCRICFYGLYASLNADYLMKRHADFIIGGEYEGPLADLIDALENGFSLNIEGVSDRASISPPFLNRLSFPEPFREHLPPLSRYASLEDNGKHRVVGYVEASRGCKHLCLHCPIPPVYGGKFFLIPGEVVLEDIRTQIHAGATHITFGDPDFLNGPRHSLKIVKALHREFPEVTFDFTAKVEHLVNNEATLFEFSENGCIFMISAVESLSDTVLQQLKKNHTRKDIETALTVLRKVNVPMRPSLVPFTPWETLEGYSFMLEFIEREGLIDHVDPVQYTIRLLIPPGSSLLSNPSLQPFLGPLIEEHFSYRWTHPDPRMDQLQKRVAKRVEEAADAGEDPYITFHHIRELARATAENRDPQPVSPGVPANRKRPPRLTEAWFCCAEPMVDQLRTVEEPNI